MRFTIIPDDKFVSINGIGYLGLQFTIDNDIHAVQWYETFGEVEYKTIISGDVMTKPDNQMFSDYDQFEKVLDVWKTAHDIATNI